MVLNKFFINVLVRVTCIVISCLALGITLQHLDRGYYYTLSGLVFLIVMQAWWLVNQVNKTNTDLDKFFSSVQDQDSSVRFREESENSSFRKLHDRMNYLNSVIQHTRIKNERTTHFMQSLVNQVDIGLLSFDKTGNIEICNRAAFRYLKVQQPQQLSAIEKKNEELFRIISTIRPGHEILHKISINNLLQNVLIRAAEFKFDDQIIKLVSFQDITHELDKKELDSWQKLIRVLTHEIMNSISPITSLTSVISGYFKNGDDKNTIPPEKVDHRIIDKTLSGLETIEETSKGLLSFVDKYRRLTALPKPEISKFSIDDLFSKCKLLMDSRIPDNIKIISKVYPDDVALEADFAQVEQIVLNLLKNAIEAISDKKNGVIHMKAFCSEESTIIEVEDNGIGISDDLAEEIFVPFYTTKENGSGIGLSLSKQIMQNHNGTISVNSKPGKGAVFTLKFQS